MLKLTNYFKIIAYLVLVTGINAARAGSYDDFFMAIVSDNAAIVRALLERGFDPNSRDPQGQAALFLAVRNDSLKVADVLLAHPATDVNVLNEAGESALMIAALNGRLEWCQRLLERGAQADKSGWTPLHYAASGPQWAVAKLLLDRGARVEAPSPNGTTPLMMAARYGTEASVELLLARGADVRRKNERGLTASDFARIEGREELAQRLAKLGN